MSETHVNLFSGSPLNRLSWLRPSQSFLNAIIASHNTRWILFNAQQPLMLSSTDKSSKPSPAYATSADVKSLLGPEPYFGQGKEIGDLLPDSDPEHDKHSPTESARHRGLRVVFLGVHETKTGNDNSSALPSAEFTNPEAAMQKLEGTPYFAADISGLEYTPEDVQKFIDNISLAREGKVLKWTEPRALMTTLDGFTAGLFASAKSLVDWNVRNQFCPGCGAPSYSMWGGWKIACSSLLPWADNGNKKPCFTAKGLHNFTHPRTDAVVIMLAFDETGDKVLLGRGRRYPGKFYSALAGFIEPGESLEDAVAREMWEEAGVHVWNVKYHSTQPWPYPANLMVGFYARADSTKPIRTDLDNELVDARWFTRQEVEAVLAHADGTRFRREDFRKMNELYDERPNTEQLQEAQKAVPDPAAQALTPKESHTSGTGKTLDKPRADEGPVFLLPPVTAIAGVLIRDWVDRKIGFPPEPDAIHKGNL